MTNRTAFLLLATLVAMSTGAIAGRHSSQELATVHHGFTLVPPNCEGGAADCGGNWKAWTPRDIDLVKQALDEIVRRPDGKAVVARAQAAGVTTIRRTSTGFNGQEPVAAIGATLRRERLTLDSPRWIELHDRFFMVGTARDRYSGKPGYLFAAQLLLHEVMHAMDVESYFASFARMVGFTRAGASWKFGVTSIEEVKALSEYDAELKRLEQTQDFVGQNHMNRRLALGLRPVRVPSIQSLRGPGEAFAEIGSHLILDPAARKYPARGPRQLLRRQGFSKGREVNRPTCSYPAPA